MDVKLVMFKSNGQRRDFALDEGVSVIGRGEECELRIALGEISRRHAELTVSGATVTIKDLDSSNGTFVNLKQVEEQELEPGDNVSIGPVVFTVQIDGEPEDISPVRTRLDRMSDPVAKRDAPKESSSDKSFSEDDLMDMLDDMGGEGANDGTRLAMGDDDS